jgi:hypothetical protein
MQPDGNLVIYNNTTPVWASDTWNANARGGRFEIDLVTWTGVIRRPDGSVAKALFTGQGDVGSVECADRDDRTVGPVESADRDDRTARSADCPDRPGTYDHHFGDAYQHLDQRKPPDNAGAAGSHAHVRNGFAGRHAGCEVHRLRIHREVRLRKGRPAWQLLPEPQMQLGVLRSDLGRNMLEMSGR